MLDEAEVARMESWSSKQESVADGWVLQLIADWRALRRALAAKEN